MHRRFFVASAVAVVVTAAFLPGSGIGASAAAARGTQEIPVRLTDAIRARLGAVAIRSSSVAQATQGPGLGVSVALSADGTTALVGAPGVGRGRGAAYVFHVSDAGSWSSSATPTAALRSKPSKPKEQFFGFSVALSADGTTAFVGAPLSGGLFGAGAVYAFHVSAEDAWVSTSTPTATLTISHGLFVGFSLALSPDGTTLVVGAPFYNLLAGGAYVFHAASESAWASTSTPTATLSNTGESPSDSAVGFYVAISGDGTTALLSDSENSSGGGAYVYHVAAENAWTTSATPTAILSDAASGSKDELGFALALSGDGTVALLGAPGGNSVDVFHASGAWATTSTPTATLTKAGGSAGDAFGVRVALSADGTTALVTAPGSGAKRGATHVFRVASEGAWASSSAPTATLTNSGGQPHDTLGAGPALSADGATAVMGAPGVRFQTGAADVFHVADASSWATNSTPNAILTNSKLNACVVPRLKGLTVAKAKASLRARSCRLGRVGRVHAKGKKGRVVSQRQKPGSRLPVDSKIGVKLSK